MKYDMQNIIVTHVASSQFIGHRSRMNLRIFENGVYCPMPDYGANYENGLVR